MLNIVLPIAGRGSRFAKEGYILPKPLIPVHGIPMIQLVTENLRPNIPHRFIYICQEEHIEKYDLENKLRSYTGEDNTVVIPINYMTEGQVCTVLVAKDYINNDDALMSANADQWVDIDINDYLKDMENRNLDGLIMTMKSTDPKWSFAKTDENGYVVETAEKKPISDDATVGIFNFKHGCDLVRAAEQMISENVRVNNEFYTCPCYNYLIKEGKKIGIYGIGEEYNGMYGLGIPYDLKWFESHDISKFLTEGRLKP
jgi:NDP-sugar pyrophosphorylase family protein